MAGESGSLSRALWNRVPHAARPALKRLWWHGQRHTCPVCSATVRRYLDEGADLPVLRDLDVVGGHFRPASTCPVCRANSRTRLVWLYLEREARLREETARVLHLAPEIGIHARLSVAPGLAYTAGDLHPDDYPWADDLERLDLTALPFPDDHFDVVIANHILEHIPDESAALAEVHRVLRPEGWAMLAVPIAHKLDTTLEDPQVHDPAERERRFGQHDHVRLHGRDYPDRLRRAGFDVGLWDEHARAHAADVASWHLNPREVLPIVTPSPSRQRSTLG